MVFDPHEAPSVALLIQAECHRWQCWIKRAQGGCVGLVWDDVLGFGWGCAVSLASPLPGGLGVRCGVCPDLCVCVLACVHDSALSFFPFVYRIPIYLLFVYFISLVYWHFATFAAALILVPPLCTFCCMFYAVSPSLFLILIPYVALPARKVLYKWRLSLSFPSSLRARWCRSQASQCPTCAEAEVLSGGRGLFFTWFKESITGISCNEDVGMSLGNNTALSLQGVGMVA